MHIHEYSTCLYSISGVKTIDMKWCTKTLICLFEFEHFTQIWTKQHIFSYLDLQHLQWCQVCGVHHSICVLPHRYRNFGVYHDVFLTMSNDISLRAYWSRLPMMKDNWVPQKVQLLGEKI